MKQNNNSKITYLIFAFCLFSLQSFAQFDVKAEELLNSVSKKYEAIKSYKAEFSYELENLQAKVNDKFTGEINVKGNKFTLKMGSQMIINNGTTVWTYLKEENEVNISDYAPEDDEISPTKIHSMYRQGFKYLLTADETIKKVVYNVVELIPENKKKPFFKIKIWISKKDKSIFKWKIFEKNGNRYLYSISKFQPNVKFEDSQFSFDKSKYAGVEVVDLR
ncbi:MAG: LolA family protein [Cytophagales bacterium]